jgi:hypothetical protein
MASIAMADWRFMKALPFDVVFDSGPNGRTGLDHTDDSRRQISREASREPRLTYDAADQVNTV